MTADDDDTHYYHCYYYRTVPLRSRTLLSPTNIVRSKVNSVTSACRSTIFDTARPDQRSFAGADLGGAETKWPAGRLPEPVSHFGAGVLRKRHANRCPGRRGEARGHMKVSASPLIRAVRSRAVKSKVPAAVPTTMVDDASLSANYQRRRRTQPCASAPPWLRKRDRSDAQRVRILKNTVSLAVLK